MIVVFPVKACRCSLSPSRASSMYLGRTAVAPSPAGVSVCVMISGERFAASRAEPDVGMEPRSVIPSFSSTAVTAVVSLVKVEVRCCAHSATVLVSWTPADCARVMRSASTTGRWLVTAANRVDTGAGGLSASNGLVVVFHCLESPVNSVATWASVVFLRFDIAFTVVPDVFWRFGRSVAKAFANAGSDVLRWGCSAELPHAPNPTASTTPASAVAPKRRRRLSRLPGASVVPITSFPVRSRDERN